MATTGQLRVGTSGFHYEHWRGVLYPEDLPKTRWLERYAEEFDALEINNTFYRLPAPSTFDRWREAAPPGFRFALKFSRYATHMKRLRDPEAALASFLPRAERLRAHLGPVLVQLPPRWHADPERLDAFLSAAPRRIRWAIELRDPDWLREQVFELLRRHQAALVVHDLLEDHPRLHTAAWTYRRFHGARATGRYSRQFLVAEAARIREELAAGLDVWAFFNNDAEGHAVHDARALRRYVRK